MCVSGPCSPHICVLVTYLCCFVLLDIYFSSHVIYFLLASLLLFMPRDFQSKMVVLDATEHFSVA